MARILGVEIPNEKKVAVALTHIYGIGPATAYRVLSATRVSPDRRVKELTEDDLGKIASYIQQHYRTEGDLRQEIGQNIKRLVEIGCYRGLRHKRSLPVRGQRTRSNARTRKGPRKTVGVVRDKAARKAIRAQTTETKE